MPRRIDQPRFAGPVGPQPREHRQRRQERQPEPVQPVSEQPPRGEQVGHESPEHQRQPARAGPQEGQRRERDVERRLPVGPAGDVDQRAPQFAARDGLAAVCGRPLRLSGLVPVTAVEDGIGRADRPGCRCRSRSCPARGPSRSPSPRRSKAPARSIDSACSRRSERAPNGITAEIRAGYLQPMAQPARSPSQTPDRPPRDRAIRQSRGPRPRRAPRDRSKAGLRHRRSPPGDRSRASKGRRSPRTSRLGPSRRATPSPAIKTAAAGAKSATRSWPANPPHHQSPITSIASRWSISTPNGMLV